MSYRPIAYETLPGELRAAVAETLVRLADGQDLRKLVSGWRNAAMVYLQAMPEAAHGYGIEGVQTQLLYVISNLTRWQHPEAKRLKGILKKYAKSSIEKGA